MQIFARLTKVNEADRTIEGVIASEAVDRSGEIFDYEKSKPNFIRWSSEIGKATGGKNIGNVRAMHGNVSAGITKHMQFDDAAKQIVVKAEITDDNEWNKVLKGNYTGLSIGGKYAEKWQDEKLGKTRYAAEPSEYSLVDLPCNPEATFTVVKADGAQEMHKFEHTTDAESLAKWAEGLSDADAAVLLEKIARRKNVDPKEGKDKYGDVKFADPENKKYPIDTAAHIRAAWSYIHMPKNAAKYGAEDAKKIKARIAAAWKDKIDAKGPPEAEKFTAAQLKKIEDNPESFGLASAARAILGEPPVEKGLWAVSQFAGLLEQLCALSDGTVYETEAEGDDSKLPEVMAAALKPIAHAFLQMAEEEVNEALHGELNDDAAMELAAKGDLAKVGRKHTKKTREHHAAIRDHLDKAKEHLDALAADDPKGADDDKDGAEKMAKAASDLQKVTAERDELQKAFTEVSELLKKMLAEPAPAKGALRVVEKSGDHGDLGTNKLDDSPVLKADGSPDPEATALKLIKVAHSRPVIR